MKKKMKYFLLMILVIVPVGVFAAKDPCKTIFGSNTQRMLSDAYKIMRFAVPILLLGLSSADFIKAVSGQNADDLQKAIKRLGSRIVIAILILVLPTILYFILNDILGIGICKI